MGIDRDERQIKNLDSKVSGTEFKEKVKLSVGNFKDIKAIAKTNGFDQPKGILFDLGLSMGQISELGRGFSFKNRYDHLDMRLDDSQELTAEIIINSYEKEKLYEVLSKYSEELFSRAIVEAIVRSRSLKNIRTVGQIIDIIDGILSKKENHFDGKKEKVYARVFQALRIETNDEYENLRIGLEESFSLLQRGGRIVVISFHSGEDRIIKRKFIDVKEAKVSRVKVKRSRLGSFERSAIIRVIEKI